MKTNIVQILNDHGYEVIREIEMKRFILQFTGEKKKQMLAEAAERGYIFEYDINEGIYVEITEVGFNENGNLYIDLRDSVSGELWDTIEY